MKDSHLLLIQIYTELLPTIRDVAKQHGYAIAVHGSLTRDFDLIAVPWANEVQEHEILLYGIMDSINMKEIHKESTLKTGKEIKPHNRVAYAIQLGYGMYIDLSIILSTSK
jgi:hypothetical protein